MMCDYMSMELVAGNLGQKHKYVNQCVNNAIKQNVSFKDIRSTQEISVVDKLFKIDIASKCKDVDYIIERLKERTMLYVSRALKSTWLVKDIEYMNIINPQYLEEELFPTMLTTAVNKTRHFIYINLKDETRCNAFYWYYKSKQNLFIAKHFLPKCSEDIVLSEMDLYVEDMTPYYLKLLCEKCPRVLLKFFDIRKKNRKMFEKFNHNLSGYLDVTKLFLKSHPDIYFEVIERYCSTEQYDKRISPKATKYIMQKHKDRYMAKPELYGGALLHLPTLARHLSEEEVKDLVVGLARAKYLVCWFTLTYKSAEPLLQRINKKEKAEFVKKIFEDKNFGSVVTEMPYPLPEVPFPDYDEDLFSKCEKCELEKPLSKSVFRCMDYCSASQQLRKVPTLLDELFNKYRFTGFSKTFFELKKMLLSESLHTNRLMILNVLVSKTLKRADNIHMLLELVSTRHANEPSTLRASFLRSLVRRAAVYRLPEEPWLIFQEMVLQLIFQSEEQVPCNEGLHAILIHHILNDCDIPLNIFSKFITLFDPLVQYDLSVSEKQKVFQILYKLLIVKCETNLQEDNFDVVIEMVDKIFKLLKAHKINLDLCPEVIDIIKRMSENDLEKSKGILMQLYQMRKYRKVFIKENFFLIQNNASYVNALRHDVSLLTDTNKFAELVMKGELKMDEFLTKIKVYFEDLAQKFKLIIEDRLKTKPGDTANLKLSRALCILQGPAVLSDVIDLYAGGKESKKLAQRLAANLHMALSVDSIQGTVYKNVGVIASRNMLSALPAASIRAQLPELLIGPAPFVRLGLALAFDRLLPDDILKVIMHIRQKSKIKMKRVLLNKFYKYMCLKGESLHLDLWEQMKELMMEFCPYYNERLWKVLSESKSVPKVVEADYCLTILFIQFSEEFKLSKFINLPQNLHCISKKVSELKEVHILRVLKPFLEYKFEKGTTTKRLNVLVDCNYIKILTRFLLSCETETIQNERFKTVGLVFLYNIKNSWNDTKDVNRWTIRRHFQNFILNLKYNEAFLNDNFVNCLPLFKNIVEEMHTFLDVKRHFKLYSYIHLTMVYYKTLRHIKKLHPSMLSEQSDSVEVASAVGYVFGRYLAREHRQLLTDYFSSITYLYVDDVSDYIAEYKFGSGRYLNKFRIAVIQGVTQSGDDGSLFFATLMLYKMGFLNDLESSELRDLNKLISNSKDTQIQTFLSFQCFGSFSFY